MLDLIMMSAREKFAVGMMSPLIPTGGILCDFSLIMLSPHDA